MNRSWIISILIVALIVGSSYVGFSTDERDRNVSKESDIGYGGGKEESTLAGSRAGESTTIVITEMCGSPDFCEMVNVGRGPITITGWKLHGYDEGSRFPNPDFTLTFPATVVPAGGVFTVTENGGAPGVYPNFFTGGNIMWVTGGGGRDHGAILVDSGGNIVDVVVCGDINPQQLNPTRPAPGDWVGQPVVAAGANQAEYRTGDCDTNTAGDWLRGAHTKATLNGHGMTIPFTHEPQVENVTVLNTSGVGKTCYARYSPYTLHVNVSTYENLDEASELRLYLDYNTTNATLGFNWTRQEFYKLQDIAEHVLVDIGNCTVWNDGEDNWWLNFSLMFNFTFPHEDLVDSYVEMTASSGESNQDRFPRLFRVERDLEFVGEMEMEGEYQGELSRDCWIRGGENISLTNLVVQYQDSDNVYANDSYFDVMIRDSKGNTWWDNTSSGEEVSINLTSRNRTDENENYLVKIVNIPGSGLCQSNITFPVKIDADAPLPPPNLICHADSFKDKETEHTSEPHMYVTWDPVIDNASGLMNYYYSRSNNSGTPNGSSTNETEVEMDDLPEGFARVYVWCVDKVGNIGEAASSGILVDMSPPVFTNLTPVNGTWHNYSSIECSVEIHDINGSGVDGDSVEYSVSTYGANNFNMWIPVWMSEIDNTLKPSILYNFPEGEENFIKWRAKDVTGNDFTESTQLNIKVDITSISFGEEITPHEEWYAHNDISTSITVWDTGIGVDLETLSARISTTGPDDFGEWNRIGTEKITDLGGGRYDITVTFDYLEGKDNYIMFRGTDLVGNPMSLSDKFNLKIDRSPVYFGDFTPREDIASDELTVECYIAIYDDGAGVDAGTVEYSISTEGDGKGNFGEWKKVPGVVAGNPTQALLAIEFDWGMDNYIRWRGDDKVGTGTNTSRAYGIWINSKPEVVISSPDDNARFQPDEEIFFDGSGSMDLDGDNLTFFWTSNIAANRTLGRGPTLRARLVAGEHTITLFVSDGHGNNITGKIHVNVGDGITDDDDDTGDDDNDDTGDDDDSGDNDDNDDDDDSPGSVLSGKNKNNFWMYIIIGGIFFLLLLILIIFLVARKKKKEKEDGKGTSTDVQPMSQPGHAAPPSPYSSQGQFLPHTQQGYVPMGLPGPNRPPGLLALPPAGPTGGAPYPSGPTSQTGSRGTDLGTTPPLLGGIGAIPGQAGGPSYLLPSFSTDEGDQNLNTMALPPGPDMSALDMLDLAISPGTAGFSPTMPGPSSINTPEISPPPFTEAPTPEGLPPQPGLAASRGAGPRTDTPPTYEPPTEFPPTYEPPTEFPPTYESPTGVPPTAEPPTQASPTFEAPPEPPSYPPPAPAAAPIPAEDPFPGLPTANSMSPDGPPPTPPVPPTAAPEPPGLSEELTMSCHSCGNDYMAMITSLPAVVTCTHCQTQGMVESL